MSPRLRGYIERLPHDFSWVVDLLPGKRHRLFEPGEPEAIKGDSTMVILDVAVSRSDAELQLLVGMKPYILGGPWLGHKANGDSSVMIEVMKILMDAALEGRTEEVKRLTEEVGELLKTTSGRTHGLLRPLVVPVRQSVEAYVTLHPLAPAGLCEVHLRTLISREVA